MGYLSGTSYLVRIIFNLSVFLWKAEGPDAFSQFHLYVCSAFLINWSKKLQEMDFQVILKNSSVECDS